MTNCSKCNGKLCVGDGSAEDPIQSCPVCEPAYRAEYQRGRNDSLEEVAREFDKMKIFGTTAESFAAFVRAMKR